MSRSSHQLRQQQKLLQQQQLLAQQQQIADNEAAAAAAEMFDLFCVATTMRQILGLHRNMCDCVGMRPAPLNEFYPKLKAKIRSWKGQALWKKLDARASHRAYAKGTAATGTRVLVIGAGPCGLRTAIEAQLLGAKVVVVEKRDRISRNNVLHLWPFVITDLRNLGAKKFYGKFCAGSIDHISIRQLQCMLLKVALLLGVEIHEGVSFEKSIEPSGDGCGWRASITPTDHVVSHYEFDVLIGADGKRNTLEGFKRKEFRGKLAIAITANFINKKTEAEAKAEEISGVAFIFNQSFFKELYHTTGIDLENIVYYKDETHYFVMTAKKHSLIDKGVIMQDFADPAELLAPANVNAEKLLDYAREAAEFSTKYQMPNLEFAVNHYGKPDVAMFDFTSMFAAETSCRVIVRKGFRLMQCLVGDSLLEPFWPTGSGCARGFLSSMDAAYAIKLWSNTRNSTLGVLAQRESIYRLLNQTTPENLQRDIGSYTVDPATRYPNLNRTSVNAWQVKHLIDTDDIAILEQTFMDTNALQATQVDTPVRRKRRSGDTVPLSTVLLRWISAQLHSYEFTKDLKEVSDVFTHGKVLCALINRYRPDLVDLNTVKDLSAIECNELAFKILDQELHIPRIMSGKDSVQLNTVDSKVWLNYLEQICEVFRGEIPHVKHPKMDFSDLREKYRINYKHAQPDFSKLLQISTKQKSKSPMQDMVDVPQVVQRRSVLDDERLKRQRKHEQLLLNIGAGAASGSGQQGGQTDTPRRAKKRRSAEKATNIEERQKRLEEIQQNRDDRMSKRRQQRYQQTQNFYKSLHMLHANTLLRESGEGEAAFEDYSIFLYRQQAPEFNDRVKELERKLLYPDRDRSDIPSALPRATDEQFSDRIKSMEQRITSRNTYGTDKKPKDLMRAIGKIDSTDWNVREIEKKIEQSKKTEIHGPKGREKVPKWSKEQFAARQHKMAKPQRQDSGEEKFKEIDQTLKNLDKQLKEGRTLEVGERGHNKVASIAGQFVKKDGGDQATATTTSDEKNPSTVVPKSSSKVALAFKKQAASEKCHFCKQTVYLMEKINTEGLILHRSCLKCHHCHTNLRLGGYAFDRDDPNGHFYCTQHFRLPAKAIRPVMRKPGQRKPTQQQQHANAAASATAIPSGASAAIAATSAIASTTTGMPVDDVAKTPDKLRLHADNVAQLDLLDRGQTPERIEFENTDAMSDGEPSEEHIIDEHEWSGRNFLPDSNNDSESDLSSSDESDSDTDSEMFEEANDSPLGAQTLQLANDWIGKQHYSDSDDSDDFYDSSEGIADDGKDDTEGEEFKKARELRREEVRLLPLPANLPTDTETESKLINENKENIELVASLNDDTMKENINGSFSKSNSDQNLKQQDNDVHSEKSFKSATSSANGVAEVSVAQIPPVVPPSPATSRVTKFDIEKLKQNSDYKFSAEIEAISEKLHHLNSMVKMNKDLESLAKENLVRSDILKKLSLKEKWLADNSAGNLQPIIAPKSKFEEKLSVNAQTVAAVDAPKPIETQVAAAVDAAGKTEVVQKVVIEKVEQRMLPEAKTASIEKVENPSTAEEEKVEKVKIVEKVMPTKQQTSTNAEENLAASANRSRSNSLKTEAQVTTSNPTASPQVDKKKTSGAVTPSRSNSFKSNASAASNSPQMPLKSANVSRSNSLRKSEKFSSKEALANDSKMQLENILDIVKRIDISKSKQEDEEHVASATSTPIAPKRTKAPKERYSKSEKDVGKLLYSAENKFSPVPDRRMTAKLKEIEATNFAGTMDNIKSQMVMPTVSTQAAPSLNLSKYFPNQKQEKALAASLNKNQKNLKDVDLTKYFPTSPVAQKRSTVVTVADKLKKSQTEKSLATMAAPSAGTSADTKVESKATVANKPNAPKRQSSLGNAAFSLRDHQLDGAVDLSKKKTVTTTATATTTKKGNVKIIKKIVPKGTKAKKAAAAAEAEKNKLNSARDESDRILDEILHEDDKEAMRSPSLEYQKLFKEEKSPSEDVSDKIERILEETGIDLGIPRKQTSPNDNRKKLMKAKSLGEGEFERRKETRKDSMSSETKEEGDRPSGVQNILKRFESMSSVKSDEHAFKLRRMESTTSNLNKSRDSMMSSLSSKSHDSMTSMTNDLNKSSESLVSRESDTFSDLEKTMEYLKFEWRNEATNFLQKKRDKFYAQKRDAEEEEAVAKVEAEKQAKYNDIPIQYRESKFAKFFGIKAKSPSPPAVKRKSPIKKKSPEKKTSIQKSSSPTKNIKSKSPPKKVNNSMDELAKISNNKQTEREKKTLKASDIIAKLEGNISAAKPAGEIVRKSSVISLAGSKPTGDGTVSRKNSVNTLSTINSEPSGDSSRKNSVNTLNGTSATNPEPPAAASRKNSVVNILNNEQIITSRKNSVVEATNQQQQLSPNIARQNSNNSDGSKHAPPENNGSTNPVEKKRPLVEDIKNLPKTGCDKSLSNSRRGSQTSLQSPRRLSDSSLNEKLENVAVALNNTIATTDNDSNVDELFNNIVDELDNKAFESHEILNEAQDDCDSLCTSISKSPSVAPVTVRMRGSSEDESIEKLFGQFSDEMLVNVEFDSNDELIGITQREVLIDENDADRDYLDKLESLERDDVMMMAEEEEYNVTEMCIGNDAAAYEENKVQQTKKPSLNTHDEPLFPTRPQRRQKSSSSSSETSASAPIAPQRIKKKLAKLSPSSMPPSVQDMLYEVYAKQVGGSAQMKIEPIVSAATVPVKFPRLIEEDDIIMTDAALRSLQNSDLAKKNNPHSAKPENITNFSADLLQKISNAENISNFSADMERKISNAENRENVTNFSADMERKISNASSKSDLLSKSSNESSPTVKRRPPIAPEHRKDGMAANRSPVLSRHSSGANIKSNDSTTNAASMQTTLNTSNDHLNGIRDDRILSHQASGNSIKSNDSAAIAAAETIKTVDRSPILSRHASGTSLKSHDSIAANAVSNPIQIPSTTDQLNELKLATEKNSETSKIVDKSPILSHHSSGANIQSHDSIAVTVSKPTQSTCNGQLNGTHNPKANTSETSSPSTSGNLSRQTSKGSLLEIPNRTVTPKNQSKERSLEWDMEKLPNSPMPRRKFVHAERIGLHDRDPSPVIAVLNNLSYINDSDSEETQRRIIEDFEMERRQALIKRDQTYQEDAQKLEPPPTPPKGTRCNASSKRGTPLPPTPRVAQSPRMSRRSTQESILTNRTGSPPMSKTLVVPSDLESLPEFDYSRRSSFAFTELSENAEPKYAPMPKKLELPKIEPPKYIPDKDEPIAEVFKDRQWPKSQDDLDADDDEHLDLRDDDADMKVQRSNSPVAEIFKNRQWPDGATDFSKEQKLKEIIEEDDANDGDNIETLLAKTHERKRRDCSNFAKQHSQSPQLLAHHLLESNVPQNRKSSKSISDLRKNSPYSSIYNSTQSLHQSAVVPLLSHSSVIINEPSENFDNVVPHAPARTPKPLPPTESVDAGTRMLLDRSKHLHNRKRDFINERVAERNPYMKDVIDTEKFERQALADAEEELESYRPQHHYSSRTNLNRFPTSRALGRHRSTSHPTHYDYISTAPSTSYSDYGSTRRLYGGTGLAALPTSSVTSLDYLDHHYPSTTNPYSSTGGRGLHFSDYFKRSSPTSSHRDRDHRELSRESCVQTESDTSSPDEVELNSATEISTDSEFDHDEITRETPKIFIDDTHLRKPTKVQVKSTIITPGQTGNKYHHPTATTAANAAAAKGSYLQKYHVQPPQPQFKPLVQVDPTLLLNKNRTPLQNPRPGDYLLNKTASTEGIASKKSLELKKRYLLGEPANGNKIQKSGSTSVLDSKIRSFQSNISECQKLLNPGGDISPSMKTFLDRTKLSEHANEIMRSATTNIINDLKVEITIQKASSTASTDNEKENVFVNSKNELNKGMEYSETVNTTLLESMSKKSPTTPTNNQTIIETVNLVTPEKQPPIIDLTKVEIPTKMLESNVEFINNIKVDGSVVDLKSPATPNNMLTADSNKIIDLTGDSPVKSDKTIIEDLKPDLSKDVKESIPDILGHIGKESSTAITEKTKTKLASTSRRGEEHQMLLSHSGDEEKMDSPEKQLEEKCEHDTVQIQVPNIPWNTRKTNDNMSSTTTGSSCTTSNSSSIEDIQHYILESTTSPDTQTAGAHQVPRLEVHDTSGTLMQIDSLMIIDGKYVGDPEDLKYMEIPEGVIIPEVPAVKTTEVEDEAELDVEPVTATPEPAECTVIEAAEEQPPPLPEAGPPLPEKGPPSIKPANLKFDTKNENKIESLKNLPLIVDETMERTKAVKPMTLNLSSAQKSNSPITPTSPTAAKRTPTTPTTAKRTPTTPTAGNRTPLSPLIDNDKTPTADLLSRGSDSETEPTGTGQVLTETELSDWTADDCISENFVDMEFVLNSNKGTIKRNKKGKKKLNSPKLPSTSEILNEVARTAPVAEFEGILKSIDIDDIEFMDTGSEGSCAEAYSATNTALLRNRGYMEFIETTPKQTPNHEQKTATASDKYNPIGGTRRDEKLGIDYIEQGAYIMQNNGLDLLKTPVNESPEILPISVGVDRRQSQPSSVMTQSLTDSSTLNDIDDDSLFIVTSNSQAVTKTTTEESEALTIVTSPLDSSSPRTRNQQRCVAAISSAVGKGSETAGGSTPSSSDKNPRTSQSCTPSSTSTASSSKATPPHRTSQEFSATAAEIAATSSAQRKPTDEFNYEDYVRVLQQKIAQISSDSLDTRKQRRKSSKGEAPATTTVNIQATVIEQTPAATALPPTAAKLQLVSDDALPLAAGNADIISEQQQINKVPEIPTLTRKLEELTKERTKQKDLIHDLVMDKLQSKKQLNAEKRLHRSRQRTMLTSGYASGSSLSPTPKIAAASTTSDTNCTNQAHYHESTAAVVADERPSSQRLITPNNSSVNFKENNPLQKSVTYVSTYGGMTGMSPTRVASVASKQRPFSEHLDQEQLDAFERYKLNKTPSFSYALSTNHRQQPLKDTEQQHYIPSTYSFATPNIPTRYSRARAAVDTTPAHTIIGAADESIHASTENLRSEARARARLKSNSELGLSPEEKMQLLRKRLQFDHLNAATAKNNIPSDVNVFQASAQQAVYNTKSPDAAIERDLSARDRRLSASKSVNDLAYMYNPKHGGSGSVADENSNTPSPGAVIADFTSDPNLLLSSTSAQANQHVKALKSSTKSSSRQKDPERRKSLIQSLSNFFHKSSSSNDKKDGTTGTTTASVGNSAQTERPGTSGSNTTITSASAGGNADGVFSRFRISPKSKEKSKDKDGYPTLNASSTTSTINIPHERSNSQDCISKLNTNTTTTANHNTNRQHTNNNNKKSSTTTTTFSSSSPQLYVVNNKTNYNNMATTTNTIDEQTPPPIPPLPLNYQRSDDESYATETREQKKLRAISKAVRQAELKRLRIAQEIQREQEEIEVQLKELEARGVLIEKALRGEGLVHNFDNLESTNYIGNSDEKLLKELLEIWRNITQLKKRDEELSIRQQELQLEHRHAQLKEELNLRLSCNKLDKNSADVAAEGAILNEMLDIVAKRAALRPTTTQSNIDVANASDMLTTATTSSAAAATAAAAAITITGVTDDGGGGITLKARVQSHDNDESNI